jgi:hypothetical protein
MEWKTYYLDMILVPLGFFMTIGYHVWLWHKLRSEPFSTTIGINAHARRFWVPSMLKVYYTIYYFILCCNFFYLLR